MISCPVITKIFGPKYPGRQDQDIAPDDPTRPLLPHDDRLERTRVPSLNNSPTPSHGARVRHARRGAAFDLLAATWSLIVDVIFLLMTCFAFGPRTFAIVTILSSFGAGYPPAVESLALALMPDGGEDAGRLFGAFAVAKTLT